ncbi:hypothetical protein AB0H58_32455 [Nocardia neocaledoniensis]|uniref:hypothetical protein n=1 Tax=Nocardia neocaledoniensis TaxID=236511 RepID=UPI0033DE035A
MHHNDLRAALIGTAASALTVTALMAWSEFDVSYRIVNLVARARMTPEQRRECDELLDLVARDHDYANRNAVKITLPDARDQLSADEIADLVAMTPGDLLNDAARTRAALDYRGGTYVSGEWSAHNDRLSVLSGEVARRFSAGRLSPLERAQLVLAQRYIHGSTNQLLPELRERGERV